jgi:hypothetical protein
MGLFDFVSDVFDFVGDVFGEVVSWFVDIPEPPNYEDNYRGVLLNKQSNLAQIPVVYGQRQVGGTRVFVETSGTDNEYLYICLVLCEGEIQAIGDIYINDILSTDSRFSGLVSIDKKLGSDTQTVSSVLLNAPSWTSDHTLKGVAYLGMRFKWNRDVFGSIPEVKAVVQGRKCYDPRNATTAYTTNPAICLLDYMTNSRYGKALTVNEFDTNYASWKTAADICDSNVTAYTGGSTIDLFSCNAVIDTSKNLIDNVKVLLSGMQGLLTYSQGKYKLIVENQGTASYAFTEDNILGGITINGEKKRDRFNRVIATFANPEKNWQQDQVEYPEAGSATYTTLLGEDNGFELEKRAALETITNVYQARNLAYTILYKSRNGIRASFLATVDALQLEVGDIVSVTHSSPGWSAKPFRITGLSLQSDGNVGVTLQEHQNSVYVWNEGDEVPEYADTTLPDPFQVTAVDVNTVSVASSEAINDNGSSTQRFLVSWTEPSDEFITEYVVQYKESSSASWNGEVKTDSSPIYISGIQSGVAYNVRIKAVNAIGVSSAWATLASAVTAANLTTEAGGGNTTYYQNTAPTGDLLEGDLWFDSDDSNKPYRYNGSTWDSIRDATIADAFTAAANAQSTADGKITAYYQASAPTGADTGDMWIDTDDKNRAYRYTGSAWSEITNTDIAQALSDAADAQSTADGKIESFYQTSAPTAAAVGDLWFDTDDNNKPHRWSGSAWVSVRDGTIADAITAAAGAQATADGKVTTFYQNSAPTADGIGDLWIDTDDNNKLYRWSGSAWTNVQDGQIATAISDAANAQATADGKIVTFYQTSTPTGASLGDIWFDTDNSNKVYRYNGTSWVGASGTLFNKDEVSENEIALTNDQLSDITADLGTINAGTVNVGSGGVNIRSASSGSRIQITANRLEVYDGTTLRVRIGEL